MMCEQTPRPRLGEVKIDEEKHSHFVCQKVIQKDAMCVYSILVFSQTEDSRDGDGLLASRTCLNTI